MVSTVEAIIITQVPIALGVLIGAYLLWDVKRELVRVLEKLSERKR